MLLGLVAPDRAQAGDQASRRGPTEAESDLVSANDANVKAALDYPTRAKTDRDDRSPIGASLHTMLVLSLSQANAVRSNGEVAVQLLQ